MSEDDRSLLDRVAERDLSAFEELYGRYFSRLFGFVYKISRRGDLVEEIVQETLLVVWRDAARFDGRSRVASWIFGIAYRRAAKLLAQESRRAVREGEAAREAARLDRRSGPEQELRSHEAATAVWRALGELSPEQRAVVELTFYENCSYGEIAQILDCPVNTVKTRMYHARQRLRSRLPASGLGDVGSA